MRCKQLLCLLIVLAGVLSGQAPAAETRLPVLEEVRFLTGAEPGTEISDLSGAADGTLTAAADLSKEGTVTLVLAGYSQDGFLTCAGFTQCQGQKGLRTRPLAVASGTVRVRLMAWDSVETITPLPESRRFEIAGRLQTDQLAAFEDRFDRMDTWFANLYDRDRGGFYYAISGRDNPGYGPTIETTGFVLNVLDSNTNALDTIPDAVKQKISEFFVSHQDPETGLFVDDPGPVNERETARNQSHAMKWVERWNIQLPVPHPSQALNTVSAAQLTAMDLPDYLDSPEAYLDWLKSQRWRGDSWAAGDLASSSLSYIDYLEPEEQEIYRNVLLNFLNETQDPETGMWDEGVTPNSVSGAFKVGLIYGDLHVRMPNADKIIDSIFLYFEEVDPDDAHYVRNPLSVLSRVKEYDSSYRERIRKWMQEHLAVMCDWMGHFQAPDGGFAAQKGSAQIQFGGYKVCDGLWEGDVDSNSMVLVARDKIYSLLGEPTPKIQVDPDFWDWITGEKPVPSPYLDPAYDQIPLGFGQNSGAEDFESWPLGTPLNGNEFGDYIYTDAQASIAEDPDRPGNRVLRLAYQGTGSRSPLITVANFAPLEDFTRVRYLPAETLDLTAEFDIRFQVTKSSGDSFYVGLGIGNAYALNFHGGADAQRVSTRVSSGTPNYGGSFATLTEDAWHRIKVEYHIENRALRARVYVDGEQVSENGNFFGITTKGIVPSTNAFGAIRFVWYANSAGEILADNLKMEQTYYI